MMPCRSDHVCIHNARQQHNGFRISEQLMLLPYRYINYNLIEWQVVNGPGSEVDVPKYVDNDKTTNMDMYSNCCAHLPGVEAGSHDQEASVSRMCAGGSSSASNAKSTKKSIAIYFHINIPFRNYTSYRSPTL